MIGKVTRDCREIWKFRYVLTNRVATQLRMRYHYSLLGFFWSLLNPLLLLAVLTVIFSALWHRDPRETAFYLFSGRLPWTFFSETLLNGSRSIIAGENLLRNVYLPKIMFICETMLFSLCNFLFEIVALFILFFLLGMPIHSSIIIFPVAVALLTVFAFGGAILLSALTVYFRDLEHLTNTVLYALFFLSPILFRLDQLSPKAQQMARLNPMVVFLGLFQDCLFYGRWPEMSTYVLAGGMATGLLLIGYVGFSSLEDNFIYRL